MTDEKKSETIAVRIPSRLDLLAILDRVTESVCQRLKFDEDTASQVSMSVIEAGTNAIQHGHHKDASKPVDIEYRMLPEVLEITIEDAGPGFDLARVNGDITSPEHIFDARGRGIFIMRSCMDRVDFEFTGSGTRVRLIKNRPAKAENP
jgi:serine/threonine-protein kinase RsbW